jgi:hypothetical protein
VIRAQPVAYKLLLIDRHDRDRAVLAI